MTLDRWSWQPPVQQDSKSNRGNAMNVMATRAYLRLIGCEILRNLHLTEYYRLANLTSGHVILMDRTEARTSLDPISRHTTMDSHDIAGVSMDHHVIVDWATHIGDIYPDLSARDLAYITGEDT